MNKDVIYIDVEDDITAIIGKVKDAKEKIVALVPPKRIGVLQSAVNLQLLARAATQADKRLVLISNNSALAALAAAAKVPVAKNLQSKPELAEIAALDVDNGEDVIDGAQLPVGELAKTADSAAAGAAFASPAVGDAARESATEEIARAIPPAPGELPRRPKSKNGAKVPNFNTFRKKLILGIGGGVLLLALLIWGIFFAPHATVLITARTTDSSANAKITLGNNLATSASADTIKAETKQTKKDVSVDFTATGTKDVGEKATGTVTLSKLTQTDIPVPAGTKLTTSGGLVFVTAAAATIPASTPCFPTYCAKSTTVSVTAESSGTKYNSASGSLSGAPDGASATFSGTTSGGTDKTITVVTAGDIQKATDQLANQGSDDIKKQLAGQFKSSYVVVDQSFKIDRGSPQSTPAVDQEAAGGKAKLTGSVTYSLAGIAKTEVSRFLDEYFKEQLKGTKDQRVYDNGSKKVTFTNVTAGENGFGANLVATAKIGPKIDDEAIKNLAKGKRYGEIQSSIESIQGVDDVDIKFSPFWVSAAPNDVKKISVEFNLNESE